MSICIQQTFIPNLLRQTKPAMKTLLISALILPLVSACAMTSTETNQDSASANQENVYTTGSNLPSKQNKKSNMQTLSPEQAADMIPPVAPRGPKG
jgi:hypothetical protein